MKAKAQVIDPRERGYRGPTLPQPIFTEDALTRAEETLEEMSASFEQWLDADLATLQAVRIRCADNNWNDTALDELWRAAHDLKGMGGTYGYPIVTQLAASLCKLTETESGKAAARANPALVTCHVDALRAAVRDRIATDEDPVGRTLLQTLEAHIRRLGVAPG